MMQRDIDQVIELVRVQLPKVKVAQLSVKHAADDDGIWFFTLPSRDEEIQLESSSGSCPFVVEHDGMTSSAGAVNVTTVKQAALEIINYLEQPS